jgi:hypothetical protein
LAAAADLAALPLYVASASLPQRMFPRPVEALDQQRVLFIGLVADDPHNAYIVVGRAAWTGAQLRIAYDVRRPIIEPSGTPPAWRGFDPAVLPEILVPEAWRRVEPLVDDVVACVVAWVSAPLPAALVLVEPFFGVAENRETGEIFLMQGDPSMLDSRDDQTSPPDDGRTD